MASVTPYRMDCHEVSLLTLNVCVCLVGTSVAIMNASVQSIIGVD